MSFITDALFGSDETNTQTVKNELSPAQSSALQAQADLINRMIGREGSLWPQIMSLMNMIQPSADAAKNYSTAFADQAYPGADASLASTQSWNESLFNNLEPLKSELAGIRGGIGNLSLSPDTLNALGSLRDERINSLKTGTDELIGNSVADLARRGMMSSSTAEGAMGNIAKQTLPYISSANQDYWNSRLNMPFRMAGFKQGNIGQQAGLMNNQAGFLNNATNNAVNRFHLAEGYGNVKAGAEQNYISSMLQPWLRLWSSAFSGGTNPVGNMGQSTTGTKFPSSQGMIPQLASSWMGNQLGNLLPSGNIFSSIGNLFGGGMSAADTVLSPEMLNTAFDAEVGLPALAALL